MSIILKVVTINTCLHLYTFVMLCAIKTWLRARSTFDTIFGKAASL